MNEPAHPFAIRDFRLFWLARFCAVMATMGMVVIIGWQLYDQARLQGMTPKQAAFQLGLLGLFQFVPLLVLTPVAGWVADRFERRKVAAIANMIDLCVAVSMALLTARGALTLPILFAMAALHGTARVFVGPAMSAITPNIVPAKLLPNAIALSSISWQAATVIGPAAAGVLYAASAPSVYWAAAALLALASTALLFIRPIQPTRTEPAKSPLAEMAAGLRYCWRDRFLLGCITLDLFAVLLAGATALLPVFARDILHVGPEGLGQLRAAPSLGAAVVGIWLSFRPLRKEVGIKMLLSVAIFGAGTIAFGLSENYILSLALLVFLGAADMVSVYIRSTLVQLNTPDAMRGRVSSVANLAVSASNELGELQSGFAAALLGPVGAVVAGGAGAIVVTGLWAWLFPQLRNAKTFAPQTASAHNPAKSPAPVSNAKEIRHEG